MSGEVFENQIWFHLQSGASTSGAPLCTLFPSPSSSTEKNTKRGEKKELVKQPEKMKDNMRSFTQETTHEKIPQT